MGQAMSFGLTQWDVEELIAFCKIFVTCAECLALITLCGPLYINV